MSEETVSVLIVEDEEPIRALLVYVLNPSFQCLTAETAGEAIALLDRMSFNIILADVGLPGMSGIELCRRAIEKSPATAVIIISGKGEVELVIEAIEAGAFDFILKPFDLSQVMDTVVQALNRDSIDRLSSRAREWLQAIRNEKSKLTA